MGCKSPKEPKKFEFEEEEEKQNDNNQNDNDQNDNNQNDNDQNDDKQNDDKQSDDNQNDNKQNDDKQGDDKQNDDKQGDDKQNDNEQDASKQNLTDEKKEDEKKEDEKKEDEKKEDEKKDDKKEIKFKVPENKSKYDGGKPLGIILELKNIKEEDVELKYHQVEQPDKMNPLSGVRIQKYSKDFKLDAKELVEKKWYMIMAQEKISITGFSASNVKPPVVTPPLFFYIGEKNPEEEKKEEGKETLVCYGGNISEDSKEAVSDTTIQLLKRVGEKIEQDVITITSTIFSPKQQAEQIYNNMEKGNNIAYQAPGESVKNVWRKCRGGGDKLSKEDTVKKMTDKIEELARQNRYVTPHCVPEEVYEKLNVIDISYNNLKVQEFINALCEEAAVKQVLHGKQEISNPAKAKYLAGENGVHVEINR